MPTYQGDQTRYRPPLSLMAGKILDCDTTYPQVKEHASLDEAVHVHPATSAPSVEHHRIVFLTTKPTIRSGECAYQPDGQDSEDCTPYLTTQQMRGAIIVRCQCLARRQQYTVSQIGVVNNESTTYIWALEGMKCPTFKPPGGFVRKANFPWASLSPSLSYCA